MDYEAVVGLEVHAQIHTRSKMYCACAVVEDTGALPPNRYVCPTCLALPGALPVVNRRAVEVGVMTALALHGTVHPVNVFARKSYFYPDLPKGYQISQYELPLATGGYLEIETEQGIEAIGITRVHLEEDTAKIYHQEGRDWVDFNRAGVPLLEIVSEPDLRTVEQVRAYATALHAALVYLGVNSGDMEKGVMRFEANVSVRPRGSATLGTRTEIKNLNSFRALARAVEYEIARQSAVLDSGGSIAQQTLGWNEAAGETFVQRSKEHAHDYRYFPEPDIPPVEIAPEWVETLAAQLPELPLAKQRRLVAEYGIRPYDAEVLVAERVVAEYFEAAATAGQALGVPAQEVANWITGELFRLMKEGNVAIAAVKVTPQQLAALLALRQAETLSVTAAKTVLGELFVTGEEPQVAVARLGLAQISDVWALSQIVQAVAREHPAQVAEYLAGKTALAGWLVGQVMQASQGKANPQQARQLLEEYLERQRSS